MTPIYQAIDAFAHLMQGIAFAMFWGAAVLFVIGLWCLAFWGIGAAFKNWRLYSRNPLAVRIRRWLDARRAAARERRMEPWS